MENSVNNCKQLYFSKDAKEERLTHYTEANGVVGELFDSLCSRYWGNLET